jgi:hypothetical protein
MTDQKLLDKCNDENADRTEGRKMVPTAALMYPLPEFEFDFRCAAYGQEMYFAIWDVLQDDIRARLKYGEGISEAEERTLESIRSKLCPFLASVGGE